MSKSHDKYFSIPEFNMIVLGWDITKPLVHGKLPYPKGHQTLEEAEAAFTRATGRPAPPLTTQAAPSPTVGRAPKIYVEQPDGSLVPVQPDRHDLPL